MSPYLAVLAALTLTSSTVLPGEEPGASSAEPVRMAVPAFGTIAEVEVRDLPPAEARQAVQAALTEIFDLSQLVDPRGTLAGGVGALNLAAGQGPRPVDGRLAGLLLRSLQFCIWSSGAYGPLGGDLRRIWSERQDPNRPPSVGELREAVGAAECSRLRLHGNPAAPAPHASSTVDLLGGSQVDLTGIARGFAIDRAVELLAARGAGNVWVEIGNVRRARGSGPDGRGWLAELPPPPGGDEPLDRLWLRDQALAITGIGAVLGADADLIVDQRTGVPPRGVVCVVAVTEQAVDAEPLVRSLFVLGHHEGHMRLGTLQPRPSVYWLLGEGFGAPLEATYRWSELERVRRR